MSDFAYENFKPAIINEIKSLSDDIGGIFTNMKVFGAKPKNMKELPCVIVKINTTTAAAFRNATFVRDYYVNIDVYANTLDDCEEINAGIIDKLTDSGLYLRSTGDDSYDVRDDASQRNTHLTFSFRWDGIATYQI